jgi:glycosyltransferase involved in cell wall biosynthesis
MQQIEKPHDRDLAPANQLLHRLIQALLRGRRDNSYTLVIDPALATRAGHPYHASRNLLHWANATRLRTMIYGSQRARQLDYRVYPCFSRSLYRRNDWTMRGYVNEADRVASECAITLGSKGRRIANLILPTCDQTQLRAIATLVSMGKLPKDVRVAGWLLFPPRWDEAFTQASAEQLAEYDDALRKLNSASEGRAKILLCFETEAMLSIYRHLDGAILKRSAGLSTPLTKITSTRNTDHSGVHFVFAGHATKSKGYELLPDAVKAVLTTDPDAKFTIHGVKERSGNRGLEPIFASLSSLGDRVNVISHDLQSDQYYALVRSADVIVLPYRMPEYENRGSGIFSEAQSFGIPVIAPSRANFAATAIEEGRAVPLEVHSPEMLATAMLNAIASIGALRSACQHYLLHHPKANTAFDLLNAFFRIGENTGHEL